jgi:DMSO/TMAO reductase YedYZ molybdopterin-dependent catalytic subunit
MSALIALAGHVAAPRTFDFDALRALAEQLEEPSALLGGREIAAVRLDVLLDLAGVKEDARSVVFESTEGSFVVSLSLAAARGCVIVYRVGDAPLPHALGGPFRLITRGRLRCGDVKALGTIYVSDHAHVDDLDTERVCVRSASAA